MAPIINSRTSISSLIPKFYREEHGNIEEYLRSKKLKIKNELSDEIVSYKDAGDSSEPDAYENESNDDDDDEDDEDFKADDQSDVPEELDENYQSSGSGSGSGSASGPGSGSDQEPPAKKPKN